MEHGLARSAALPQEAAAAFLPPEEDEPEPDEPEPDDEPEDPDEPEPEPDESEPDEDEDEPDDEDVVEDESLDDEVDESDFLASVLAGFSALTSPARESLR